jgi:hypothetical protein
MKDDLLKNKISVFHFRINILVVIFNLLLLSGCSNDNSHKNIPQSSFYFWRSAFTLSLPEKAMIDSLHTKKLFIKVFDIDWNPYTQDPQPLSLIRFISALPEKLSIVPTVFITNRTFEHLRNGDIDQISERIKNKIFSIIPANNRNSVKEIQIDCDWSKKTKAKYFHFLEAMSRRLKDSDIIISATIRLHQYADPVNTGVPPVQQGVLMFYNMGELEGPNAVNSILDVNVGKQYLDRAYSYPIHLDIALPLYRWGVLIRRERVVNLLHDLQSEELQDSTLFQNIGTNKYRARRGHYVSGVYVYPDDRIRLESVTIEQLYYASTMLKKHFYSQSFDIIFFHLEPSLEAQYGISNIRSLLISFSS